MQKVVCIREFVPQVYNMRKVNLKTGLLTRKKIQTAAQIPAVI